MRFKKLQYRKHANEPRIRIEASVPPRVKHSSHPLAVDGCTLEFEDEFRAVLHGCDIDTTLVLRGTCVAMRIAVDGDGGDSANIIKKRVHFLRNGIDPGIRAQVQSSLYMLPIRTLEYALSDEVLRHLIVWLCDTSDRFESDVRPNLKRNMWPTPLLLQAWKLVHEVIRFCDLKGIGRHAFLLGWRHMSRVPHKYKFKEELVWKIGWKLAEEHESVPENMAATVVHY